MTSTPAPGLPMRSALTEGKLSGKVEFSKGSAAMEGEQSASGASTECSPIKYTCGWLIIIINIACIFSTPLSMGRLCIVLPVESGPAAKVVLLVLAFGPADITAYYYSKVIMDSTEIGACGCETIEPLLFFDLKATSYCL